MCSSVLETRERFLEEVMTNYADPFLPLWPLEGKSCAKRGLRSILRLPTRTSSETEKVHWFSTYKADEIGSNLAGRECD